MSITVFINTMARYRRYTKTIVKAPKKKWNKGIVSLYPGDTETSWLLTAHFHNQVFAICANKVDNTAPTPGVLKVKHVKLTGQIAIANPPELVGLAPGVPVIIEALIMYLPQICFDGVPGSVDALQRNAYIEQLISDHPEWIMNRRIIKNDIVLGIAAGTYPVSFTMSSGKLSRNLNSGDRLAAIIRINTNVAVNPTIGFWYNVDATFASTFN